jgi:hypothetical protein
MTMRRKSMILSLFMKIIGEGLPGNAAASLKRRRNLSRLGSSFQPR